MKEQLIVNTERVDDITLLLARMHKMRLAELIDEQFPGHGNWQGLSIGHVVVVWLAYILSEGDHRLNHVEGWAAKLLKTLSAGLGMAVQALDVSDDRLAVVLDYRSRDGDWAARVQKVVVASHQIGHLAVLLQNPCTFPNRLHPPRKTRKPRLLEHPHPPGLREKSEFCQMKLQHSREKCQPSFPNTTSKGGRDQEV